MRTWKIAALAAAFLIASCGHHGTDRQHESALTGYSARVVLSDSTLALSADSFPQGQVSLLVRNDGSQPSLLRVDGPDYSYPLADQPATMVVPHDSVVYFLHLAAGTYHLRVDGSPLPPTPFVVH